MSGPKMGEIGRVTQLTDSALDRFPADARLTLPADEPKRLRDDAFRQAAYALVERDIRAARMTGLLVTGHGFCGTRINTVDHVRTGEVRHLIDAVDLLLAKEGR